MVNPKVSMGCLPGLHVAALLDGSVRVEGLDHTTARMGSADQATKAMIRGEFDVGEMSVATYVKVLEQGAPLTAVPVFTGRKFLEPYIFTSLGFTQQSGLQQARFGLAQYWMSASIWQRWLLAKEHDVDLSQVTWVPTSRDRIEDAPIPQQFHINEDGMGLTAQELFAQDLIDVFLSGRREKGDNFRGLHVDSAAACSRFFGTYGFIPIMHLVTIRTDSAAADPEIARKIVALWTKAHDQATVGASKDALLVFPFAEDHLVETRRRLGKTWNEYGLTHENELALNTFFQAAADQGLTRSRLSVDDAIWNVESADS